MIHLDVIPCGAPRQTQRDKWQTRPAVVKYRIFKDELRLAWLKHGLSDFPARGTHITFVIPMPKSWSNKKRTEMCGQAHRQKPDIDNLLKSVLDTLAPGGDDYVWDVHVSKIWGQEGRITIIGVG